ncbi:hypothetical protein Bca52824_014953 [Brassica carinata]|uniref:Uncharacterized protein n=1 Tax=Brassica carinata TaxID=52824 RepID=A0A8X7W3H2_BRACI|nr:hypothetical protein Bca52824_014953 [Brassica carinata]
MIQTRDEVSNHDLLVAGSSNVLERGTEISPLIMSNMIQTRDEISSTHDSPIAGSSNAFERNTHTLPETEWNNIQRVDEVSVLLQVVLLAIREDCTRWYMDLKSQNYQLFLVDVKSCHQFVLQINAKMMMICSVGSFSRIKRKRAQS